jgi:hypothetical protein
MTEPLYQFTKSDLKSLLYDAAMMGIQGGDLTVDGDEEEQEATDICNRLMRCKEVRAAKVPSKGKKK